MLGGLLNSYKIDDLRNRIIFLFIAFAVFILSIHITVPGVNLAVWQELLKRGQLLNFLGMFTGGALNNFSITAMGITPYINASIIMSLLPEVFPALKEMSKEGGEMGRRKIGQITRYLTIGLALFQATMMTVGLQKLNVFSTTSIGYFLVVILSLTAGTALLMWLGEMMTDKGIGNGVSMLIFAGIVLRYPNYMIETLNITQSRWRHEGIAVLMGLLLFVAISVALIAAIIIINQGLRKIPVQYAKRVIGRRVMGGQSTYIPMKINNAGVISIIFAISVLYFPITILEFLPEAMKQTPVIAMVSGWFRPSSIVYNLAYAGLVIFFTYFYSYIQYYNQAIPENLKKYGGFIPGIRPGKPTAEYLERILSRVTFISAIFLAALAVLPSFMMQLTNVTSFYLGSTSLLIIVGVVLDTMQQIEARLVMRQYQGFIK